MKRTSLLNRDISHLIASLGHMDEIVIGDAGLPIPKDVAVIDLAVTAGIPSIFDLLKVIRTELAVEKILIAQETGMSLKNRLTTEVKDWETTQQKDISIEELSHEDFKRRTRSAKTVIRTGETTPYANVILVSGVVF